MYINFHIYVFKFWKFLGHISSPIYMFSSPEKLARGDHWQEPEAGWRVHQPDEDSGPEDEHSSRSTLPLTPQEWCKL